jgi:hypothetical protein
VNCVFGGWGRTPQGGTSRQDSVRSIPSGSSDYQLCPDYALYRKVSSWSRNAPMLLLVFRRPALLPISGTPTTREQIGNQTLYKEAMIEVSFPVPLRLSRNMRLQRSCVVVPAFVVPVAGVTFPVTFPAIHMIS